MTQRELIIRTLLDKGVVTNIWAIQQGILRLSERIRELKEDHWMFDVSHGTGKKRNVWFYKAVGIGRKV